jgi:hypothetical protein
MSHWIETLFTGLLPEPTIAAAIDDYPAHRDVGTHYFWYNLPRRQTGAIRQIRGLEELTNRWEVLRSFCYKQTGGVLYPEGLNPDYFCSVVGRYVPGATDPPIAEFVRAYDDALEVLL